MLSFLGSVLWIILIVGLISPNLFSKVAKRALTRKQIAMYVGGTLLAVGVIATSITPQQAGDGAQTQSPVASALPAPTPEAALFDLSTAKGKTPAQMVAILGQPDTKSEPNDLQKGMVAKGQMQFDADYAWKKNGQSLLMTFDYATGAVKDFFLDCNGSGFNGSCSNNAETLASLKAQLNADASGMKVEAVKVVNHSDSITGITLTP